MLGALINGTPQLLLPKGADQFCNADLMAAAGLAPVLEPSAVTAESVAAAATRAMVEHRPAIDAARARDRRTSGTCRDTHRAAQPLRLTSGIEISSRRVDSARLVR